MILSVIIPVYNAHEYLERCLESVRIALERLTQQKSKQRQTAQVNNATDKDFAKLKTTKAEIIAIDNDSDDDSLAILQEYAQKYPGLMRVLTCSTPGAAAVRNLGMREAQGKYTWFVDADDEVTPEAAQRLVAAAEAAEADLTTLGLTKIYPDGHQDYVPAIAADDPELKSKFIRNELGPVQVLIRHEWYLAHGFSFLELLMHEDMEMMPALVLYTDKYASVDEPLYLYHQNPGSTLHPTEWEAKYFDIFPALMGLYERFERAGAVEEFRPELEWFFIWNLLMDSATYFRKWREGRVGLKRSREMLRLYFPGWRRNKFLKRTSLRTRLKIYRNYWG